MKERLYGVDFIRAVCAIGIICFHYCVYNQSEFKVFYNHPYGGWGDLFVAMFFAISGGMLYYNHPRIDSLKSFYIKRWKTIFPAFYIGFFFVWLDRVYETGTVFYGGAIWKIILSVLGMDGYFAYRGLNYYLIGEWFLGAIIMLYLLYPLLLLAMDHCRFLFFVILTGLLLWEVQATCFQVIPWCNMISCMFSFYIGMLCFKHIDRMKNKWVILASFVLTVVFFCIRIPVNSIIAEHILAVFIMVLLYNLGVLLMRNKVVEWCTCKISAISYEIFLLQHVIILKVLQFHNSASVRGMIFYLMISVLITMIYAMVLHLIVDKVSHSRIMKKIH